MTPLLGRYRHAVLLALFGTAIGWGLRANAQDEDPVQKAVELNKKALAAYANLEMEEAASLLNQALEVCRIGQLEQHPVAARTHVHLGVVQVAGLKKRNQGIEEFKKALRIDPNIKVTKSMINPEVQAAFQEAAMDASEGPSPPPPASAEPSAPAGPTAPSETTFPGETPGRETPTAGPGASAGNAMVHIPVTEAAVGRPIVVKVQVPASLGAERVVVLYRPEGAKDFHTREIDVGGGPDWYQGEIPAEATGGESVAYYLVAQNAAGQSVAQDGSESEPHVVALREGGGASAANPEAAGAGEGEQGEALSLWVAITAGSGFGYHSGTPEANHTDDNGHKLKSSGIAMSRLLQICPEIGWFASDSLVLSLQGRFQLVSGASSVKGSEVTHNPSACNGGTCHPASYALAGLAKATWFLGEPKRVTPFLSLAAGAGQIREVVSVGNLSGCPNCKDTVVGGLGLLGAGGGMTIELSDSLLLVASASALVGVPNLMANLDVNLGLAYVR